MTNAIVKWRPAVDSVYCMSAELLLGTLPDASISLIATDPPYNGVKDSAWDNQWPTDAAYLDWLRLHLREMRRVLKPNGSLYVFASPRMAARVELVVGECFNVLNHLVWYKTTGNRNWSADKESIRSFLPNTERVIFAEQQNAQGFIRIHRERAAMTAKELTERIGAYNQVNHGGAVSNWEQGLNTPSEYQYARMRQVLPSLPEYRDAIRPFNGSAHSNFTDVWNYMAIQSYPGKHECEKPLDLMRHIVSMSSRPGDTVLDCFAGSGATLDAARQEGRHYIGCDMSAHWVKFARNRLSLPYMTSMFASIEGQTA